MPLFCDCVKSINYTSIISLSRKENLPMPKNVFKKINPNREEIKRALEWGSPQRIVFYPYERIYDSLICQGANIVPPNHSPAFHPKKISKVSS